MTDLQEKLVALTRDLIMIPSSASNPEDRERCFEFIKNHINGLDNIYLQEYRKDGIPSLVALPNRIQVPEVLFCAHLDVISHPKRSCYRSRIMDNRIYGPGAGDMKGTLAIVLELFNDFHSRHNDISLGLVVTSDEETGGKNGIQYLVDEVQLRCGVALIPDGGTMDNIIVEEKGIIHLNVKCQGNAAHAARPWLGVNPLERLSDSLTELGRYFKSLRGDNDNDHWYPTCALTIMSTENTTVNRIPTTADCHLDIRFPPPHTVSSMMSAIKDLLGEKSGFKVLISAEPTKQSPDPLFLSVTKEALGKEPTLGRTDAGSDARFFSRRGIPAIISSPTVGNLHSEDEWIEIRSMETFYHIYKRYLEKKLQI